MKKTRVVYFEDELHRQQILQKTNICRISLSCLVPYLHSVCKKFRHTKICLTLTYITSRQKILLKIYKVVSNTPLTSKNEYLHNDFEMFTAYSMCESMETRDLRDGKLLVKKKVTLAQFTETTFVVDLHYWLYIHHFIR